MVWREIRNVHTLLPAVPVRNAQRDIAVGPHELPHLIQEPDRIVLVLEYFKERDNVKFLAAISLRVLLDTESEDLIQAEYILSLLNRIRVPIDSGHVESRHPRRRHEIARAAANIEEASLLWSARIGKKEFVPRFERRNRFQAARIKILIPGRFKPLERIPKLDATVIALKKMVSAYLLKRRARGHSRPANGTLCRGLAFVHRGPAIRKGM